MPKIKYEFADRTSSEVEVSENFFAKYQAIVDKEKRINRKETRRHQSLDKSFERGFDVPDHSVNVAADVESNETQIELHKALLGLTQKQRTIFLCYVLEEMSFREIGQMLGISKDTAKEHYHSAVKKLKKLLHNTPSNGVSRGY